MYVLHCLKDWISVTPLRSVAFKIWNSKSNLNRFRMLKHLKQRNTMTFYLQVTNQIWIDHATLCTYNQILASMMLWRTRSSGLVPAAPVLFKPKETNHVLRHFWYSCYAILSTGTLIIQVLLGYISLLMQRKTGFD